MTYYISTVEDLLEHQALLEDLQEVADSRPPPKTLPKATLRNCSLTFMPANDSLVFSEDRHLYFVKEYPFPAAVQLHEEWTRPLYIQLHHLPVADLLGLNLPERVHAGNARQLKHYTDAILGSYLSVSGLELTKLPACKETHILIYVHPMNVMTAICGECFAEVRCFDCRYNLEKAQKTSSIFRSNYDTEPLTCRDCGNWCSVESCRECKSPSCTCGCPKGCTCDGRY